jgi:Phage integrase family
VRQRKTGHPVRFELTEQTRQAVDDYLKAADKQPGEYLFTSRRRPGEAMTTRQYARLVTEWIAGIGLDPHVFGTHSLRRTKATLICRRTGNLRAVQLLLGHTKLRSTVRYLGIEVDDALTIAEQVEGPEQQIDFVDGDQLRVEGRDGVWIALIIVIRKLDRTAEEPALGVDIVAPEFERHQDLFAVGGDAAG